MEAGFSVDRHHLEVGLKAGSAHTRSSRTQRAWGREN
uniref:Uncharacterized protein n=1 Tax=Anguilla anguilla TaxID=7936 RepID=A0A0E9RRK6_ANGAN